MANQKSRARNYATVVYPESAPADWIQILQDQFIPAYISPLHDQDLNPDGEPKKPHWHVLIAYEGVKTVEQVSQVFSLIGGVGCEVVQSLRGYARYLCHLDNPEKFQYDPESVSSLCGADYTTAIGLVTDKYKAIKEIMAWCKENSVQSFSELLEYASDNRMDWFRVLCDNGTYVIKEYLKSRSWTAAAKDDVLRIRHTDDI